MQNQADPSSNQYRKKKNSNKVAQSASQPNQLNDHTSYEISGPVMQTQSTQISSQLVQNQNSLVSSHYQSETTHAATMNSANAHKNQGTMDGTTSSA